MSKMSRAWVEAQMENEIERGNHPDAVRDLADLVIVHKYMCERGEGHEAHKAEQIHHEERRREEHREHNHAAEMQMHHHDHLDKATVMAWVDSMVDDDGVRGGHFSWHQAQQYALNKGITDEWRMLEMYAIMNAMYTDYHHVAKMFGVDRSDFYACMAKAFLEDADAVGDKVAEYYRHVVKHT